MILTDLQILFGYLTPISLTIGVIYHIITLNNTRMNQQMQLETSPTVRAGIQPMDGWEVPRVERDQKVGV
jgi:hypothetical protein